MSKELGPSHIRINTVSPGPVSTALWLGDGGVADAVAATSGGAAEDIAAHQASQAATGRFTEPSGSPTSCCYWQATELRT